MTQTTSILAALLLVFSGASAYAKEERKYDRVDTATVLRVDADAGRITVASDGVSRSYVVEPLTEIRLGAEAIEFTSIEIGDRVIIEASDEVGDGTTDLVADRILIVVDVPTGQTPSD